MKIFKFKKNLLFFGLIFSLQLSAQALESEQNIFKEAVELSTRGKIKEALELYCRLPESFCVALNMASCYFALDDYARSLLYLKKAAKHADFAQRLDLVPLIEVAHKKLGFIKEHSTVFERTKILFLKAYFVLRGISVIWFCCLILFLWILFLVLLKRNDSLFAQFLVFLMFFVSLSLFYSINDSISTPKAIVILPNSKVYSGPGDDFMLISSLPIGFEVSICQTKDQFAQVIFGAGKGWLKIENIGQI